MKRKSLLLIVTGACISMMLAGCTGDVSAVTEPAEEQEVVIAEVEPEAGAEEVIEAEVEPEAEEEVPEEPEVDPNVELSMQFLEADEDWLIENNKPGMIRDGKTYSLAYCAPKENYTKGGFGFYSSNDDRASVYCIGDVAEDTIVVDDDFVIPLVTDDDDVFWYGVTSISVLPVEQYGFTIPVFLNDEVMTVMTTRDDFHDNENVWDYKEKGFKVLDSNGNECTDIRSLNQGDSYKVCWSDREIVLTADSVYYKANGDVTVIEGLTTDDSDRVSFDLTSLPAGTYFCVESEGLFTIE